MLLLSLAGLPAPKARKAGTWQRISVSLTAKRAPARLSWYVGYPQKNKHGHAYVTDLQVTGPGGKTYIQDGSFAGGKHLVEFCRRLG